MKMGSYRNRKQDSHEYFAIRLDLHTNNTKFKRSFHSIIGSCILYSKEFMFKFCTQINNMIWNRCAAKHNKIVENQDRNGKSIFHPLNENIQCAFMLKQTPTITNHHTHVTLYCVTSSFVVHIP